MKKPVVIAIAAVIVLLAVVYSAAYTVNEAEQVVITRFGKVMGSAITEPGLHFKTPFVDEARRFDKRWLEWDGDPNQITTRDKRYIYIDVFARWRIADPMVFIEKLRDERSAQGRLDDIIDNATRNVIANHNLIEAIRTTNRKFAVSEEDMVANGNTGYASDEDTDQQAASEPAPAPAAPESEAAGDDAADGGVPEEPENAPQPAEHHRPAVARLNQNQAADASGIYEIEVGREKLTRLILEKASAKTAQLGIELKDVQIKRIDYIESVQAKVFDRMISERRRVAESFRSEGQGLSAEILGQKERELKSIRSGAYREAVEIRGQADAEAAGIYAKAYRVDPGFYEFLKTLESYKQTVDDETWILLTTDADYVRHLRSMDGR